MDDEPLYQSNCTARNLWQKYEIFPDRVELHTHLWNLVVPFDQVTGAEVLPPALKSLRLHLTRCPFAWKLDATDISEHILLDKGTGLIRHVLFTPERPAEFKKALEDAMAKYRNKTGA